MRFGIRELVFFLVLLAVPVASFLCLFKPRNDQIRHISTEVEAKQIQLEKLAEVATRIDDLGEELTMGEELVQIIRSKLPDTSAEDTILRQVAELADENRLLVKSVKSDDQKPAALCQELPLKMVVIGQFDGFYEFLLQLENLPRITRILDMKLTRINPSESTEFNRIKAGAMRAEFTLSIYFESAEGSSTE